MFVERTSVGLDVHARSVVAAAIDNVTGELVQARLTPSHEHIRSWIAGLQGPVAVAYEAGPTGFRLCRFLSAAGIRCEVVAPSKLQRPSGDRVKTDAKDAVHLARLLRLYEFTAVSIPTFAQEAARDLVRAREDCRGDLMRAQHRLSELLLRQGIVYSDGQAWTNAHDVWLRRQRFDSVALQMTYESDYDAVLTVKARRDRLDTAIALMAADSEFTPLVHRLGCLRGVSALTGFALAVEIGDWHQFTENTIGSFVGLVPSEHSSGASPATAYQARPKATPTAPGASSHDRVRYDRIDKGGTVTPRHAGRLHHIGIGREHAHTRILLLVHDRDIRIIAAPTGELLRELVLDPTRDYQPTGRPPGPKPKTPRTQ